MVIKAHDKVHYAWAVYEYAREYIMSIRDLASFIYTNDKHKTFAEAGFPVAALPCGTSGACWKKRSPPVYWSWLLEFIVSSNHYFDILVKALKIHGAEENQTFC